MNLKILMNVKVKGYFDQHGLVTNNNVCIKKDNQIPEKRQVKEMRVLTSPNEAGRLNILNLKNEMVLIHMMGSRQCQ